MKIRTSQFGWVAPLVYHFRPLTTYFPYNGVSDGAFHLFAADRAEHVGDPHDTDEAERVEWVPWPDVVAAIDAGQVGDGLSLTALLWVLAHRPAR